MTTSQSDRIRPFVVAILRYCRDSSLIFFVLLSHGNVSADPNTDSLHAAGAMAEPYKATETAESAAQPPSLTLDQVIDLTMQGNPDLQMASERIGSAEALLGEALSTFYPQVKARAGYQYSDNPAQVFGFIVSQRRFSLQDNINNPGGTTDFRPEIVGTISLFRGGQDYHRSKAAELGVKISKLEHSALRNRLLQTARDLFYALLAARENHFVALRGIKSVESELEQTRKRYRTGSALKSDMLSLEVQLARARQQEIKAANAIDQIRTGMRTLMGLSSGAAIRIVAPGKSAVPEFTPDFSELLGQALSNRVEISAAERLVETRLHELDAARGGHLPRADAFVSYGMNRQKPGFSSKSDNLAAGISVEVDLFAGFATRERVRKAEHQLAEAREQVRKTRLQVSQEVRSACLTLEEALQRLTVSEKAIAAAEEAFRLVTLQRNAGMVTVTRFIEAQVARDQARAQVVAARYDALRVDAELDRAIGVRK